MWEVFTPPGELRADWKHRRALGLAAGRPRSPSPDLHSSKTVARNSGVCLNAAMTPLAAIRQRRMFGRARSRWRSAGLAPLAVAAPASQVSLVVGDSTARPPARDGQTQARPSAKGRAGGGSGFVGEATADTVVVAGLRAGTGEGARLIKELQLTPGTEPESLLIRKLNREGKDLCW